MPRLRHVAVSALVVLTLAFTSSCYTYGTEPEFVRGKITDQPQSMRRAALIPAELFMEQYEQFRQAAFYGQRNYRVAVGVRLSVEVPTQGIDQSVYVGPDGQVDLDMLGPVQAAGKQLDELRRELKDRYGPFFRGDFQVNVNTDRPTFVSSDGRWNLAGRATLVIASSHLSGDVIDLQGDESLTEVLFGTRWGHTSLGVKPEWKEIGVIREVPLDEEGEAMQTVIILCDLEKLLFGGDTRQNVPIRHKDVVFVPRRRDTLIEELHDSMGYWASFMTNMERIRDVVKAMEDW